MALICLGVASRSDYLNEQLPTPLASGAERCFP